jgi:hypothetical protein
MLQFQEAEDKKTPATTTWAAEFLIRVRESKEFFGLWTNWLLFLQGQIKAIILCGSCHL